MTIGNFKDSSHTTATFVGGASWSPYGYYYIDDITVTLCDSGNGVNGIQMTNGITIFPNPTTGKMFIDANNININKIAVTDYLGKPVLDSEKKNGKEIDISNYPDGIYLIEINTQRGNIVKKIILSK